MDKNFFASATAAELTNPRRQTHTYKVLFFFFLRGLMVIKSSALANTEESF